MPKDGSQPSIAPPSIDSLNVSSDIAHSVAADARARDGGSVWLGFFAGLFGGVLVLAFVLRGTKRETRRGIVYGVVVQAVVLGVFLGMTKVDIH